jgi:hypothetical protein
MMKEILRNRATRTIAASIAVMAGLGGIAFAEVDNTTIHSPANTLRRVEQLVPGYNPEAFHNAQQAVFDFKQQADLTAKTIQVPENVTQAAAFIRDGEETNNEGTKLYRQMRNNLFFKNLGVLLGSCVVGVSGAVVLAKTLSSKPRERITQRRQSNSADA